MVHNSVSILCCSIVATGNCLSKTGKVDCLSDRPILRSLLLKYWGINPFETTGSEDRV